MQKPPQKTLRDLCIDAMLNRVASTDVAVVLDMLDIELDEQDEQDPRFIALNRLIEQEFDSLYAQVKRFLTERRP